MQRWIDIPEEIRQILFQWRPSPLVRAYELEESIGDTGKIFYKNESVSPAGSHKPNRLWLRHGIISSLELSG
jgi:tryptophan synthase beta chain